jgi:hypothetical protein
MEQGNFLFVTKKSHPESKTVYLIAIYKNVFMYLPKPGKDEGKKCQKDIRRAPAELWRAKIPHSTIRSQLEMISYSEEGPSI